MLLPGKVKIAVASVVKPHGIKGELNVLMTDRAEPDEDFLPGGYLIAEIEGLDVPFFIESSRSRGGDSLLVKFCEINSETEAASLAGLTLSVYVDPDDDSDPDSLTAGELIGYEIFNGPDPVGRIADLQELTPGCWYFSLEGSGRLIPAVDEMITGIDSTLRRVSMDLPEGLTEL